MSAHFFRPRFSRCSDIGPFDTLLSVESRVALNFINKDDK